MRGGTEVGIVLGMLRRRQWVLAAGLVLGVLLALLLGVSAERYRAEAQLLIGAPGTGNTDAQSLERNVNSQLSVLRSRGTARDVAARLGGAATADEVLSATTFTQVAGSDVVQIVAEADRPTTAAAIADAYVQVYLRNSTDRAADRVAPEIQRLDQRLGELRTEITAANQLIAEAVRPFLNRPSGVPDLRTIAPEALAQQQLLTSEYDRLLGERQDLQSQQRLQTVSTVLQEAVADEEPLGADRRRQVAVVLLALLASAAVALALEVRAGRPVHESEVEEALGVDVAGRFGPDRRLRRSPLDVLDLDVLPSEEQRTLWLKVDRLCPGQGGALVLLTGAAPGSGTTTVATMLSQQMALSGRRAVLVDAVGGPGSVSDQLGATGPGLVDGAVGRDALVVAGEDLDLLPYGEPSRRLTRQALEQAVRALSGEFGAVLVDTEPGLGAASGLARDAHAVVLVVDARRTDLERLEEWGLALSHLRDRLLPVLASPTGRRRRSPARHSARTRRPEPAAYAEAPAPLEVPTR